MKKIIFASFLSIILLAAVSCSKDEYDPSDPVVPAGEVTREFLSGIRVGKDGRFQYWNQDSPALKELKHFVAIVTDPNCKGYVPPQDRVATFDVDNKYPHISFCLLCDDTEREIGNPDKAAKCKSACEQNGWVPVSMRDEWWTIYGPGVKRTQY